MRFLIILLTVLFSVYSAAADCVGSLTSENGGTTLECSGPETGSFDITSEFGLAIQRAQANPGTGRGFEAQFVAGDIVHEIGFVPRRGRIYLGNGPSVDALLDAIMAGEVIVATISYGGGPQEPLFETAFVVASQPTAAETVAAPAAVVQLPQSESFGDEVASRVAQNSTWGDMMDIECVRETADDLRALKLADVVADYEQTIEMYSNPRFEDRIPGIREQIAAAERYEDRQLDATAVAGFAMNHGTCRSAEKAAEVHLAACQSRPSYTPTPRDCQCESQRFAEIWVSGEVSLNSQGRVQMATTAARDCR